MDDILDRFIINNWLLPKVFGKQLARKIVYNTEKEKVKKMLYDIYGKRDVFELFEEEIDEIKIDHTLKTLFWYYESREIKTE